MYNQALRIIKQLAQKGHTAVIAGGWVRDLVMGISTSNDIDIATSATPDQVIALFPHTTAVGKAFGVVIVIEDGVEYEVATFRQDIGSDGRRPLSVTYSSMEEDAKRRDLTINGLFYGPFTNEIIDYVHGQEDIRNGIIRMIGDPFERILEDRLRIMRVIRFSARFQFKVDPKTFEAVKEHACLLNTVSPERLGDELVKILRSGHPEIYMPLMLDTGIMTEILPEVAAMKGCEQPVDYHPEGDVFTHTMIALASLPEDASDQLRMAVLLHDVGKPVTQTFKERFRFDGHDMEGAKLAEIILQRLKFSNDFTEHVCSMVGNHMKFMHVKDMRKSRLKRFLRLPVFEEHLALHKADCMSSHKDLENHDFVFKTLATIEPEEIRPPRLITGQDLLNKGFKPGPIFKEVINEIEDQQLEGVITNREEALKYLDAYCEKNR
jgi:poly(A) polymerase